jgi:hypothetical protein
MMTRQNYKIAYGEGCGLTAAMPTSNPVAIPFPWTSWILASKLVSWLVLTMDTEIPSDDPRQSNGKTH